jgi:hypothetical protein
MARIRSVKPELRTSLTVANWPLEVRYFFVLLWGYLDDHGRGLDIPKLIAGDCFPYDDLATAEQIDKWLDLMAEPDGPVCRYAVGGRRYLHCVNWSEHQKPNRPTPSKLPQCPLHEGLRESLTESRSESPHGDSLPVDVDVDVDVDGAEEVGDGERAKRAPATRAGKPRVDPVTDPDFLRFWDAYPLKVAKPKAAKAWAQAIRKADAETLIAAAAQYRDDPHRKPDYTAHPATWLNSERWNDEPATPSRGTRASPAKGGSHQPYRDDPTVDYYAEL